MALGEGISRVHSQRSLKSYESIGDRFDSTGTTLTKYNNQSCLLSVWTVLHMERRALIPIQEGKYSRKLLNLLKSQNISKLVHILTPCLLHFQLKYSVWFVLFSLEMHMPWRRSSSLHTNRRWILTPLNVTSLLPHSKKLTEFIICSTMALNIC